MQRPSQSNLTPQMMISHSRSSSLCQYPPSPNSLRSHSPFESACSPHSPTPHHRPPQTRPVPRQANYSPHRSPAPDPQHCPAKPRPRQTSASARRRRSSPGPGSAALPAQSGRSRSCFSSVSRSLIRAEFTLEARLNALDELCRPCR